MVHAGDTYIQYPVKDLYDKDIMRMSIAAAKDMYEKGQQQIKDFYKEYGDFMSPIQKDMEWYDQNVTGRVRDTISNLYANGIDPLRSAEGRAAVAQLIYSMPTGDISKVRQSAETAKEYLKSFDDDTNPELEKFLGRDLSKWSTLGDDANGIKANGVWGTSKAAKYQDLNQYTSHVFNDLKDSFLGTDKNHYDWYGVSEKQLYESLTPDRLGGLLNTSLGQFHYQNAIKDLAAQGNLNPTEDQKMEQFRKNIVAANHERVHADKRLNELWKLQQENAVRMAIANARRSRRRSNNDEEKDAPTTFMDRLRNNVFMARQERLGAGEGRNSVEAMKQRFGDVVGYWDKMANSFENKGKVVGQLPDEEVTEPYGKAYPRLSAQARSWGVVTQGMMVKERKQGKKIYDQSQNKQYNRAVYERDRWAKISIGQYEVSKYDTSKEAKAVRTILKKDPRTITANERAFVEAYQQREYTDMVNKAMSNAPAWSGKGNQPRGTMHVEDLKKRSSDYWDTFEAPNLMPKQNRVLGLAFSIKDAAHKDANLSSDVMNVRFGRDYAYAPIRQANLAGPGRFKYNDIHNMFNRWLTNENSLGNSGIMFDQDLVRAAHFGDQLDILARPRITKEQFDDFYIRAKKKLGYRIGSKEDVAKTLGLGVKKETLNYKDKDDALHSTDTYYEVPVIRTIGDNGTFVTRDLNELSDDVEFTSTIADKNIINSENDALLQRLRNRLYDDDDVEF